MILKFLKYSATGNDFIIIDNRQEIVRVKDAHLWSRLCHRQCGIGADGILLVEKSHCADFKMRYINADGHEVDMCGNGGRAIGHFAYHFLELPCDEKLGERGYSIETNHGVYKALIKGPQEVWLKMVELSGIDEVDLSGASELASFKNSFYVNTGVPHCLFEVDNIENMDVLGIGKKIRNLALFKEGCNVNFYEKSQAGDEYVLRTYERGVEGETLSCGTGATALGIMLCEREGFRKKVKIVTKGGDITVILSENYKEIYLCGKVEQVFLGEITI